jgi:replicative DNA helicase
MTAEIIQFQRPEVGEGRVAPCDLEAEAAVLSACMIDAGSPSAVSRVRDFLRPEHFYADRHRRIFEAILAVVDLPEGTNAMPDMLQVRERLDVAGRLAQVGGLEYLAQILDAAPAVTNVVRYAEIVHNRWRERQVIATAQRIAATGYLGIPDTQAYADSAVESLAAVARAGFGRQVESNLDALKRIVREIVSGVDSKVNLGLATGVGSWDRNVGGLHGAEVTCLAGRPGMGKTTLALQIAIRTAQNGIGVLFFVQDQSRDDLLVNALCHLACVNSERWRTKTLTPHDWDKLMPACETLTKLPLTIDDSRDITAPQMRARSVTHAEKSMQLTGIPLGLVVVDYVQQLTAPPELGHAKDHEVIGYSAKQCKSLAREMSIAVLMLSQQKRLNEQRSFKGSTAKIVKPELSDLFGSAKIEHESDNVAFLIAGEETDRELVFRKIRRGQLFDVPLNCDLGCGLFTDAGTT